MTRIEYRLATPADAAELAELRWRFRAEDGEPVRCDRESFAGACAAFFRREMAEERQANWLALEDDGIVACVTVHRVPLVPRPCRIVDAFGVVTNSYTLPERRGRGIGTELLEHVEAWARNEDLELLIVWPSEQAASLYRRAGFSDEHDILQFQLRPYVS